LHNHGGYFRNVDPAPQIQKRRHTTNRLGKQDLDPLMENDENNMDADTDSFRDSEGM
jgi:hypothetical protein